MAENYEIIKGFQTEQGLGLYDYDSLHNKPGLATQEKAGLLSPEDKKKIDEFNGSGGGGTSGDIEFPVISVNGKTGEVQLTKEYFGLDKVENKSSEEIRNEITKDDVTSALGYTPPTPEEIGNVDLSDYPTKEEVNKQFEEFKIEVDSTLSIEGTAADAKAAGEAIKKLNDLVGDKKVSEQIEEAIANLDIEGDEKVVYPLVFTGAVDAVYDGSEQVEVNIPTNSGSDIELDDTLTEAGKAADAKAVGEVINQLALGVAYIDEEDNEIITLNYPSAEGVGF